MLNKNIKKLNITNIILTGILAALVFLCIDQRLGIKSTQENQGRILGGIESLESRIWAQNLIENGRRLAFAERFKEQVLEYDETGEYRDDDLLKHGSDGINAYLSLNSQEVVRAAKTFASHHHMYAFLVAAQVLMPRWTGSNGVVEKSKVNSAGNNE